VPPIRVLIVDLPGMLQEIVTDSVGHHDDIEILTADGDGAGLGELASRSRADVLIVGSDHREVALVDRPDLCLIAMRADATQARLLEIRTRRTTYDEPWADQLADAIRGAHPDTAAP
jgi:hypothetical protein